MLKGEIILILLIAVSGAFAAQSNSDTVDPILAFDSKTSAPGPKSAETDAANEGLQQTGVAYLNDKLGLPNPIKIGHLTGVNPLPQSHEGLDYEVALMREICIEANVSCTIVPLYSLPARIDALVDDSVDVSIGSFSVTPEREAIIDFIRPYDYETGATLFANSIESAESLAKGGWGGLRGDNVCLPTGYYIINELRDKYGLEPVEVVDTTEARVKVDSGECVAYIDDAVSIPVFAAVGWEHVDVPEILPAPYAFGVKQGNDVLRIFMSSGLVDMMDNGENSNALILEEQYISSRGIPMSEQLAAVVKAVSQFTGVEVGEGGTSGGVVNSVGIVVAVMMAAAVAMLA